MDRQTKAGIKTTEFWLSLLAMLVGVALSIAGQVADENSLVLTILGGAGSLLAALGYAVPRAGVKKTEMLTSAVKAKLKNGDTESPLEK